MKTEVGIFAHRLAAEKFVQISLIPNVSLYAM